jgi:SNF2 family DNA or RNA helicase
VCLGGKVNLSFIKHNSDEFYIISGIIKDSPIAESRLTYKKRLEGSAEGPMRSYCSCREWRADHHCIHALALFIEFRLKSLGTQINLNVPTSLSDLSAVSINEYGTIIDSAQRLKGAPPNSTYSSLFYWLADRSKSIQFPLPVKFEGKLVVNLKEDQIGGVPYWNRKFSYQLADGEEVGEITVFENLYLYDWKGGKSYHLPIELKDFIRKLRSENSPHDIEDYLSVTSNLVEMDILDLKVSGKKLNELEIKDTHTRISIQKATRKNHLSVEIVLHDDNDLILPFHKGLKLFCFEGGYLATFKRKIDATEFVEKFFESIENRSDPYTSVLRTSNERATVTSLCKNLLDDKTFYSYHHVDEKLIKYDGQFFKLIFESIFSNFGVNSFRYSKYISEDHTLQLEIPTGSLLDGISSFFEKVTPYGVTIYYDKLELSTWNSSIRFERRNFKLDWFDLELKMSEEDFEIIKRADSDKGYALTKTGLVLLNKDQKDLLRFMKKYTKFEKSEESQNSETKGKNFLVPFNRARIFELFELKRLGIDGILTDEEKALCERLLTLDKMPEYDTPPIFKDIARNYQVTGYNWLRFLHENKLGACLADDMGLGKTLQTIMFLESIIHKIKKVLIVCPVSILLNWEKEILKFSTLDYSVYYGGDRQYPKDTKVIITSYGVMKKEADNIFQEEFFDIFILDEVQHLKNIRSLGAMAARKINAGFRICLTGTPVENDLSEFYNILDLSIPGVWGDLQFIRTTSTKKSRLLAKKTARPFILRRTKAQVLTDLPDKIENVVYLNFSELERDKYKNGLTRIKERIKNVIPKKKYGEILKGLLELRQMCLWQKSANHISTKVDFLMENLEQIVAEGHQVLVFSQFTSYLDIIQKAIIEKHWKYSRIDGSQNFKKRQKEIEEFQAGKTSIFVISLKAGGVGLNLPQASYIFLMDPWWNPAVESQAVDRAHRIGQKNTLTVYRPIIKDSVEEKVLLLQDAKRELFQDLLADNDDQYFTGRLTMSDFESLFE